jgi:uncharacterized protein YbaR (Trm112 family)
MLADEVLALLRCPETKQTLTRATPALVTHLEAMRAAGRLRDRAGNPCSGPVEAGLVRADGTLFYPIRDGIPVLIVPEAVTLPVDE